MLCELSGVCGKFWCDTKKWKLSAARSRRVGESSTTLVMKIIGGDSDIVALSHFGHKKLKMRREEHEQVWDMKIQEIYFHHTDFSSSHILHVADDKFINFLDLLIFQLFFSLLSQSKKKSFHSALGCTRVLDRVKCGWEISSAVN